MNAVAALLVASLSTFALRYGSVRVLADRRLPPAVEVTLRHAALAIMAALVMSSLPRTGRLGLPAAAALAAVAGAGAVARRSRNITAAIAIGVAIYAAATAFGLGQ
jgi:branched-subunit amino acid transport protein